MNYAIYMVDDCFLISSIGNYLMIPNMAMYAYEYLAPLKDHMGESIVPIAQ